MNTKGTDMSCAKKNHKHMISTKTGQCLHFVKNASAVLLSISKRKTMLNVNVRIIISLFYNG